MKWVFALNERSPNFLPYATQLKVAVASARPHSGLAPHLLYDGGPNESIAQLEALGVTVVPVESFLKARLHRLAEETGNPMATEMGCGVFLRCELPRLSERLGWPDEAILYTDCDILFTDRFRAKDLPTRFRYIAVAPEGLIEDYQSFNSGVMVMHLPSLREVDNAFRAMVIEHLPLSVKADWDQYTYQRFFKDQYEKLDPLYNWKPYWGRNDNAKVYHFHGPKPWIRKEILNGWAHEIMRNLAVGYFWELCDIWDEKLAAVDAELASR